jgi:hypothetical protein
MEVSHYVLLLPIFLAILGTMICLGSGNSESDDQAQYEYFNPRVKPVREVQKLCDLERILAGFSDEWKRGLYRGIKTPLVVKGPTLNRISQ